MSAKPPHAPSQKAILSIGAGPQRALLAISKRTFSPYARRHGYDLLLYSEPPPVDRPLPWAKIALLREAVRQYEVLLWLDADLMIVDQTVDIATELEPGRFLYLVEHRYDGTRMPNSGVMLIRSGVEAEAFLDEVWGQSQFAHHKWWENAAICHVLGYELDPPSPRHETPFLAATKLLSPRWNSVPDAPAVTPRIRHYPGYSVKVRLALMLRDLLFMHAKLPHRGRGE
jgi:galactosyl transferase GMA12/MNN10 family